MLLIALMFVPVIGVSVEMHDFSVAIVKLSNILLKVYSFERNTACCPQTSFSLVSLSFLDIIAFAM